MSKQRPQMIEGSWHDGNAEMAVPDMHEGLERGLEHWSGTYLSGYGRCRYDS
jgi:hypothetical protein